MKKISLYMMALLGMLFSSCNEDYAPEVGPQSNPQEDIIAVPNVYASAPSPIKLETEGDTVKFLDINTAGLSEGMELVSVKALIKPTAMDGAAVKELLLPADATINKAELQNIVNEYWGKKPAERTLDVDAFFNVKKGATQFVVDAGKEIKVLVTPEAPVLSDMYYITGDFHDGGSAWDKAACKALSHSATNVYDDPVFTGIFNFVAGTEFKVIAGNAYNKDDIWSENYGLGEEDGKLYSGGGNIKIDVTGKYKFTIDVMNYTYSLEMIPEVPEYYLVGRQNDWSLSYNSAFYPVSDVVCSYTSYFTGAWDCRIVEPSHVASQTWDHDFGAAEESGACTTLIADTKNCIMSPAAGYYTLTVNFGSMTYSWTAIEGTPASYTSISLIGEFNGWSGDLDLAKVKGGGDLNGADTHNWSALGVEIPTSGELKFRADYDWAINWGGSKTDASQYIYGKGVQNGDNIYIPAGTYNIYLNDITGQFFFIKL